MNKDWIPVYTGMTNRESFGDDKRCGPLGDDKKNMSFRHGPYYCHSGMGLAGIQK